VTLTIRNRLDDVIFIGRKLHPHMHDAVTSVSLDLDMEEQTQFTMTMEDPGLAIAHQNFFIPSMEAHFQDLDLNVVGVQIQPGQAGRGGMQITCRSLYVKRLQNRRGSFVMHKASPSDFVVHECRAVKANYVVQPSAQRKAVHRDVPAKNETYLRGNEHPSSWSTFKRLADELGYVCFESAGTVYFGQPTWLVKHFKYKAVMKMGSDDRYRPTSIPTANHNIDSTDYARQIDFEVDYLRFKDFRPGHAVEWHNLPGFNGTYICSAVSTNFLRTSTVSVTCVTPTNPEPNPPESGKKDGEVNINGLKITGQFGPKTAASFVNYALEQAGDRYVWGGTTTAGFDCSGLVQWACARDGISAPRTSEEQYSWCRHITVAQAKKIRGALLFAEFGSGGPGHVAISLGDGRTIEARNHIAGVGVFSDTGWYGGGGIIPGMKY